jgi:hypothetical protein
MSVMPDAEKMMAILRGVFNNHHAIANLYPRIISQLACREENPISIELVVRLAMADYTDGMPAAFMVITSRLADECIEALVKELS